jgi:hypothetical protein
MVIDDNNELFNKAVVVADPAMNKSELFREAVNTLMRVRAARRLVALGGAAPDMAHISRRKASDLSATPAP